jgi:hypothetical protein
MSKTVSGASNGEINNPRRYYLHKWHALAESDHTALSMAYKGIQQSQTGTNLPADFPLLSTIQPLGYQTEEDLDGADESELVRFGLTSAQAKTVLSAYQLL